MANGERYPIQGSKINNPDGISSEVRYASKLAREADMSGCTPLVLLLLSIPAAIHLINSGAVNSLLSSLNK